MITTNQIATILNKKHYEITKKIKTDKNFNNQEYFIESTYVASNGRTYVEYIVTDLGCEQLSNRFRGANKELFINEILTISNDVEEPVPVRTEQEDEPIGNQAIKVLEQEYKGIFKRKLKEYGYEFYNEDFMDPTFLELYKSVLEDFKLYIITQEHYDCNFSLEIDINESIDLISGVLPIMVA